jgi:hypothetical protein
MEENKVLDTNELELLKKQLENERNERAKLEKNVSEQNSYITKLEADRKAAPVANQQLDPQVKSYLQRKMREDTIAEALNYLKTQFEPGVLGVMNEDLMKFLDATMKPENTTVSYVKEAFYLCYGKSLANKEHAIHKLKSEPAPQSVVKEAVQQPTAEERLKNLQVFNPNPTMTSSDQGTFPVDQLPGSNGVAPKDTQDALRSFKQKLRGF